MTQVNDLPAPAPTAVSKVRIVRTTLFIAHVRGAERYGVKWAYGMPREEEQVAMQPQADILINEQEVQDHIGTPKILFFNPLPSLLDDGAHPQIVSVQLDAPEGAYVQALISAAKGPTWGHGKLFEFVAQATFAQPPAPAFVINAGAKVIAEVEAQPAVEAPQVETQAGCAGDCPSGCTSTCSNPVEHLPLAADGFYALFPESPMAGVGAPALGVIVEASYQDSTGGTRLCVAFDGDHEATIVPGDETKFGGITFYAKNTTKPAQKIELNITQVAESLASGSKDVTFPILQ